MEKINVKYHDKLVGKIGVSKENEIYFQYDDNWIETGFSISPLKLPLSNKLYKANNKLEYGLFGVFLDSLPDAWGKLLLHRYIKANNLDESINGLNYLSLIGNSGMGALEYFPANNETNDFNGIDLDKIQDDCNKLLDSKEIDDIDNLYHLGSSLGGTRPKILIKLDNKDYMVKFSSKFDDKNISEIEYNYNLLAKQCGINVPNSILLNTKKNKYFAVERFDRNESNKIHMISVAAILDIDFNSSFIDYIDLIKLTNIITKDKDDILEMYRRMVFNVIFNNLDDHLKNFSFLYIEEQHKYRLSPAYDLTNSKTYFMEHTTTINHKGKNIIDEDMLAVAEATNIKKEAALEIIKTIKRVYQNYINRNAKKS